MKNVLKNGLEDIKDGLEDIKDNFMGKNGIIGVIIALVLLAIAAMFL